MNESWWNRPIFEVGDDIDITPLKVGMALIGAGLGIAVVATQKDFLTLFGAAMNECIGHGVGKSLLGICW